MTIKNHLTNDKTLGSDTTPSWGLLLLTIFILSVVLIYSNWPTIRSSTFEIGDFAANSLLIQDAKNFELLVGNYSRVGFNHPGPAILYVLAAGELLFHDVLKLVDSPIGGQLIAVGVYSACWLAALLSLLGRFSPSRSISVFGLAAFIYAASLADFQFLTGMWMPHMYFMPFAVLLLAAARLACGRGDSLVALAISSGFLISGHVSFVAILGIILIAAVAINYAQCRFYKSNALLSVSFFRSNASNLSAFLIIGLIFLLPLLIETTLRFPGPIADYASFGGQHKHNSVTDAISYVAIYWGGLLPMLTGFVLMVVLAGESKTENNDFVLMLRSLIGIVFSATFALWFYARYGIDLLDHKYIGLFYYSIPILAFVVAAIALLRSCDLPFKNLISLLLCLMLVAGAYKNIRQPASYVSYYNQPKIVDIYNSLDDIGRSGRLVVDLTSGQQWNEIWSTTVGVLSYAKRKNNSFVCINKNWHILFTRENQCTDDEVVNGKRLIVFHKSRAQETTDKPLFEAGDLLFFEFSRPQIIGRGKINVSNKPGWFDSFFLLSGWSAVEAEFVWSQEREATLLIPLRSNFSGRLILDVGAYIPTPVIRQEVEFEIDGIKRQVVEFTSVLNRQEVAFDIDRPTRLLNVKLTIRTPFSPSDFGSGDNRKLGVSLYGFEVKP